MSELLKLQLKDSSQYIVDYKHRSDRLKCFDGCDLQKTACSESIGNLLGCESALIKKMFI